METMRLRAIQQPSSVEELLESYASSRLLLPAEARRITELQELSPELRSLVRRMQGEEQAWCAWSDDRYIWFISGELSLPLSRERRSPVLHIRRYDEEATLQETGSWLLVRGLLWEPCGA
jgi:hypothetical protein